MSISSQISDLFDRIPRRHTADNVKEIYGIIEEYEDVLIAVEATNDFYEKQVGAYFDIVESVKAAIKKSNDNKASKKTKDMFFDEGSGLLKENMQELLVFFGDGKRM